MVHLENLFGPFRSKTSTRRDAAIPRASQVGWCFQACKFSPFSSKCNNSHFTFIRPQDMSPNMKVSTPVCICRLKSHFLSHFFNNSVFLPKWPLSTCSSCSQHNHKKKISSETNTLISGMSGYIRLWRLDETMVFILIII